MFELVFKILHSGVTKAFSRIGCCIQVIIFRRLVTKLSSFLVIPPNYLSKPFCPQFRLKPYEIISPQEKRGLALCILQLWHPSETAPPNKVVKSLVQTHPSWSQHKQKNFGFQVTYKRETGVRSLYQPTTTILFLVWHNINSCYQILLVSDLNFKMVSRYFLLAACLALLAVAHAAPSDEFHSFIRTFGLDIPETDLQFREAIFNANKKAIDKFNANPANKFKKSINQFSHMTDDEFAKFYLGTFEEAPMLGADYEKSSLTEAEASANKDWRDDGKVSPVKNQEQCGSCWAFSAVGAIESLSLIENDKFVSLSEQEIVDCATQAYGCNGGLPSIAFDFVKNLPHSELTTEKSYPYTGEDGHCNSNAVSGSKFGKVSGYKRISDDFDSVRAALNVGPLSVAVDATYWSSYSSGIFSGSCSSRKNHAVLLVGYMNDSEGEYWIVKNSWGTKWGMDGFIKVQVDKNGDRKDCGIMEQVTRPF